MDIVKLKRNFYTIVDYWQMKDEVIKLVHTIISYCYQFGGRLVGGGGTSSDNSFESC